MASAGPYANLHIPPDKKPRQHPTTQFFTGQMPFLLPNQQCQSTEGLHEPNMSRNKTKNQSEVIQWIEWIVSASAVSMCKLSSMLLSWQLWKTLDTTDSALLERLTSCDVDVRSLFEVDREQQKSVTDADKQRLERYETEEFYLNVSAVVMPPLSTGPQRHYVLGLSVCLHVCIHYICVARLRHSPPGLPLTIDC